MITVLVVPESDLKHKDVSRAERLPIGHISLRDAKSALADSPHPGYISHNRIIVPVHIGEEPKSVAHEIGVLLHDAADPGTYQRVFTPVSAATVADRLDG